MNKLGDLGEFGLIERLTKVLPQSDTVIEGIGDDCAVLSVGEKTLLVTCDAALENVHFDLDLAEPVVVGWKCAVAALSDIAAMGGKPTFMLVTLACPEDTPVDMIEQLFQGITKATSKAGAVIVGGDTTGSLAGIVVDITVLGEQVGDRVLLRSGAQPGDLIAVTGCPGQSAAGLQALQDGAQEPVLAKAHLHPEPRIKEGQWLSAQPAVNAMIDLSDGLLQDIGHICERSGCGANMLSDQLPVSNTLQRYCDGAKEEAREFALCGGEEYELIVTIAPEQAGEVLRQFHEHFGVPFTIVGEVTEGKTEVLVDGKRHNSSGGWDHFG